MSSVPEDDSRKTAFTLTLEHGQRPMWTRRSVHDNSQRCSSVQLLTLPVLDDRNLFWAQPLTLPLLISGLAKCNSDDYMSMDAV